MVDDSETPDPTLSKQPARVTPAEQAAKQRPAKKASSKKPAAKKAAAKKPSAKKGPAKKAAAKKVAKKAASTPQARTAMTAPLAEKVASEQTSSDPGPAEKSPVKKAAAKKPAAKKAPTKKPAAKKAPAKKTAAKKVPAPAPPRPTLSVVPDPVEPDPVVAGDDHADSRPEVHLEPPASGLARRAALPDGTTKYDRWALCASITEDLLNDLVLFVIGAGVPLEPLDTSVALPAMGEVDVRLALTVTSGRFELRSEDGGRARVIVGADGDVSTRTASYSGETVEDTASTSGIGLPTPPAPIPVRVEALVTPFVELGPDGGSIGLDLQGAELISLTADTTAPVPDGVDPAVWSGVLQMFGMVFGVLGAGLFESLGEHVGTAGLELPAEVTDALRSLGVVDGRAEVSVSSGLLSIGLGASEDVRGRALPVPIAGKRVGIGIASSVVDQLCHMLIERAAGDLPLPFELDVDLGEQQVGGRLRQSRVLPESFPDLRSSIRTEIRPRLLRGRLELSVQSAWLELPPALPSIFNQVSKRLGELVSLAPVRMRFPARIELPVIPDSTDTVPIEIDDLRVTTDGLGVVVALA